MLVRISPDFRANVDRSVSVFGDISDEMVSRMAKDIIRLRSSGDAPITVLINSNGGLITCADFIHDLLTAPDSNGKRPRIITVAVGNARSAAANLLALGDYAICYPNAAIHFHGVRFGEVADVTMESASRIAQQLRNRNRITAFRLARAGSERLAFHYARLRDGFAAIRSECGNTELSEVECFAHALKRELSAHGDHIVDGAIERWKSLRSLNERALRPHRDSVPEGVQFEAAVLKAVIDFEIEKNQESDWSVVSGLSQIVADFLLLHDYDVGRHNQLLKTIFERFQDAFLDEAPRAVTDAGSPVGEASADGAKRAMEQVVRVLKPFCYFAASIWQGLQENENTLTPEDAYWLGAVDEIYGSDLPCLREIAESAVDSPELPLSPTEQNAPERPLG